MTFTSTRPSIDLRTADRPTIKAKVLTRFPATVDGANGIEIERSGNVYTIGDDFLSLTELEAATLANTHLKVEVDETYYYYSLDTLVTDAALSILAELQTPQVITAAGDHTVDTDDYYLVFNKTSGAATEVTLPASADRVGPITIKDGKGDANSNNITVTPDGSETIDGLSSWVLSFAYSGVTLIPRPDGNGWWTR